METKKRAAKKSDKPVVSPTQKTFDRDSILQDYYTCCVSREVSKYIRRDVLTGRAKFGIGGGGKEVYQVAMAHAVRPGDWRADYYRGQTLLLSLGLTQVEDLLAQLYADSANDPFSGGRQMNNHLATPAFDPETGAWKELKNSVLNASSGTSPTGGQMPRGLGLAFASKVYRDLNDQLIDNPHSDNGNEVCWTEIGDASTSEGVFWESINAAGVVQAPMITIVADDGYGISVPTKYQTTKGSISAALAGMQAEGDSNGLDIYEIEGWDYERMRNLFVEAADKCRETHRPALIHVKELTQPFGHSTSGSHERYKDEARMQFEKDWDAIRQFRLWIEGTDRAEKSELDEIEKRAKTDVREARTRAWKNFTDPLEIKRDELVALMQSGGAESQEIIAEIKGLNIPIESELIELARKALHLDHQLGDHGSLLAKWVSRERDRLRTIMNGQLTSEGPLSPLQVQPVPATYSDDSPMLNAYEIFQRFFDAKFEEIPEFLAFGEDVGYIGDVNQGFAGMQEKYGEARVFDTGIREWTILGQALGLAMRGLRPIAEIQYLDYIYYALPLLADDTATLRWRSKNQQRAPMIVRTRGHRLEGIWHSGSLLAPLVHSLRGMHICVPRNSVQATGMYNTLLAGDDPALVVEVLNAYRQKENLPDNLSEHKVPLGVPEVLRAGDDITLLTYGACARICDTAAERLQKMGVQVELIDVQTLLPFDLEHRILRSLQKTNRLLIVDEDVPGGTSAYLQREVLETQGGYRYLDAPARTLSAVANRSAYGDNGDYAAKPQVADVVDACLELVAF
ncbi:MAG: thiamine pyrophosphate-dependent enzyme [Bacteroidota bacterium]